MKKCPFCAESIQDEAIKCRYCQSFLDQAPGAAAETDEPEATAESASPDDGWEDVGVAKVAAKPVVKQAGPRQNPHPVLLKPEVATAESAPAPAPAPASQSSGDEPTSKRRILYSGSPSWRAFFNQYALVVVAALIVPFITIWVAGLFDASFFTKFLAVAIPLLMAGIAFVAINVYRKSKVFRVTTTNIESEYGLLSKKIDVLELWRCRDVRYQQSLMDRILRIAHIEVMTADVTTPQLCINGLPASRQLFEKIRDSIEIQRQARNVVGFVQ